MNETSEFANLEQFGKLYMGLPVNHFGDNFNNLLIQSQFLAWVWFCPSNKFLLFRKVQVAK